MRPLIPIMLVVAAAASADDVARHFDIPAQAMQSALNEFARQSDRPILFSTDVAASKHTAGVQGELQPEAALKQLLKGTGLTFRVTADRAILVEHSKPEVRAIKNDPRADRARHRRTTLAEAGAEKIEEVFVTANRREQSLREVPQSVTALTQQPLEQIQANDFEDYARLVPGLQISTPLPGNSQVILRGLSTLNAASTAGIYVDSTPYGSSSGLANGSHFTADLNAFDLQRIEVLRGPQGTLYGASTMGGLLKFVTHPPDLSQFASRLQLSTEAVRGGTGVSAKGMLNVPLSDRLALRVTGIRTEQPGFIDDPSRDLDAENKTTSTAVRGSLLYQVSDALKVRVTSIGQDNVLAGGNDVDLAVDTSDPARQPLRPYRPLHGDLQHAREFSERSQIEYRLHTASMNWQLPGLEVMSSTSYGTYRQHSVGDVSLLDGLIQHNGADLAKFTQELQLTSQSQSRAEWVAGVYYTRETGSVGQRYTNFIYDGSAAELDSRFEELALFGTLTYKFTPRFDVALGVRGARNEQEAFQHGNGVFVNFESRQDSSEDVFLYSIAPRWRPSDATTLYMRVASGYRPGGPNIIPIGKPANAARSYDADTVLSFEAGVKADLLDRRWSVDLSAFLLSWKDLQLIGTVNETSVMSNGGEARSQGVEWAIEWRPLQGLSVDLVGAYTDAVLTESTVNGSKVDLLNGHDGDRLPYVSKWTGLVGVNYEWPLTATATAYAGANWSYIGARSTDFGTEFGHQLELPGYDTTDVRFGVEFERWSIGFYGKNLTDARGVAAFSESNSREGGGVYDPVACSWTFGSTFLVIRPRTYGLTLSARF